MNCLVAHKTRQVLDASVIRTKQGVANLFYQVIGYALVDQYSRPMMQTFKATALKQPPRLNQLGDITLEEAITQAKTTIFTTTLQLERPCLLESGGLGVHSLGQCCAGLSPVHHRRGT